MTTLRAKESFQAFVDSPSGVQKVTVPAGELLDSGHPTVKGREHLFEAVDDHVASLGRWEQVRKGENRGRGDVLMERATAEPGERRSVNPRPDPEEKPAAPKGVGKAAVKPPTASSKGKQDGEV